MIKLSGKKKAFAEFIAEQRASGNEPVPTQAARHAGYAEKSIHQAASRLMKDSAVLDYIEELCKTPEQVDLEARAAEVSVKGDLGEEHSQFDDPKDFLKHVMNTHMLIDPKLAVDSAKALLPYYHAKKGEMGKKEQREEQAQTAREGSPFKPRVVK